MSLTCEISGELLGTTQEEIVVTPSGHICIKRLLLTKLAENGGLDPFESSIRELPLSEDQLVTLAKPPQAAGGAAAAAPPRPQATSLPNLLHMIQREYDAILLELFDTRKTLEETRRELSQALYQNDAAVRVVARLAQERDAAKQELERWNASAGVTPTNGGSTVHQQPPPPAGTADEETGEPKSKRRRLVPSAAPLSNDIPEEDLQLMNDVWQQLSKGRKAVLKAAGAAAPTPENLSQYVEIDKKAWHKSANKGIPCMARYSNGDSGLIATAGKDKQLVVYNEKDQVVQHTFAFGSVATCIDIGSTMVVAGDDKGKVSAFALGENAGPAGDLSLDSAIVDISVHPSNLHICLATADGRAAIVFWSEDEKRLQVLSIFQHTNDEKEEYTCGALHPDGLLYMTGTKTGKVHVWDFKNKNCAAALKVWKKPFYNLAFVTWLSKNAFSP
jgi:pre-mRNA-processing factor 19